MWLLDVEHGIREHSFAEWSGQGRGISEAALEGRLSVVLVVIVPPMVFLHFFLLVDMVLPFCSASTGATSPSSS